MQVIYIGILHESRSTLRRLTESFNRAGIYHDDSYNLSAPYYLLTGRKGLSIYSDDNAQLVVCRHPHVAERLMVFPETGGNATLTLKVLGSLEIPKNGMQLSRYTDSDFLKLQNAQQGLSQMKHFVFTEQDENIMDWKYPVHILNTEKVSNLYGASYEKLRNKYNKVSNNLTIIPISMEKALPAMRASLTYWAGSMTFRGKETGHDLVEFYNTLFKLIVSNPSSFDGFAVIYEGEPAGFTIWDRPINGVSNGIAGLSHQDIAGMSEFQTV